MGKHDVGHSGVFTGCEVLSLSSSTSAGVQTPVPVATLSVQKTFAERS
ncbi:hypothetical protein ACQKMI_22065 [Lysinibacillus sp. NPDC097214]